MIPSDVAIAIPELALTLNQQHSLADVYSKYLPNETKTLHSDVLRVLADYGPSNIIEMLYSRVKHVRNIYFLSNYGNVSMHKDSERVAIIAFEIFDASTVPVHLYDDDDNLITTVKYQPINAVLWNTKVMHYVPPCSTNRVTLQLELNRNYPFEFYHELYTRGKLLND